MINEVTDMLQRTSLTTPTTLSEKAVHDISGALKLLLSDVFALYLKTKNFHWHMSGSHFRDYHLMLDDQGDQIFSMSELGSSSSAAGLRKAMDVRVRLRSNAT